MSATLGIGMSMTINEYNFDTCIQPNSKKMTFSLHRRIVQLAAHVTNKHYLRWAGALVWW